MASERLWRTPEGGLKVRHIGVVDLGDVYRWLNRWFAWHGYFKKGRDFEQFYNQVDNPDGSRKIEIRWNGVKGSDSPYFIYHIELIFLFIGVKDVLVGPEGNQAKMQQGDYEFRIVGYLEKKSEGVTWLRKIFEQLMVGSRVDEHKFEVYDKVYKLQEELSEYLGQPL